MANASEHAWLALLGPPAAGKTTITAAVCDGGGIAAFRLRDFALACRTYGWLPGDEFDRRDDLGWLTATTVASVLRVAFTERRFGRYGPVIFDNFPGSADQLHLLHDISVACGARLGILELTADNTELCRRAIERRVCAQCEPDPLSDPHRPAHRSPDHPQQCMTCSGPLSQRPSDEPSVFRTRLDRYRARIPAIHAAAAALRLPLCQVDTQADARIVRQLAAAAVEVLGLTRLSP